MQLGIIILTLVIPKEAKLTCSNEMLHLHMFVRISKS